MLKYSHQFNSTNIPYPQKQSAKTFPLLKPTFIKLLDKINNYFFYMESASRLPQYRQTEMQYFKDLRVLDPSQASSWTLSLADLLKLPLLQKVPEEQIVAYIDEITYSPYNYNGGAISYWIKRAEKGKELSEAAICSLSIPVHGSEVERSFSVYSQVMTKARGNCKDTTVKTLNQMRFNQIG